MNTKPLFAVTLAILLAAAGFAQRPPQPGGGLPGGPPRGGQPGMPGQGPGGPGRGPQGPGGPGQHGQQPRNEWNKIVDTNKDGNVDGAEFQTAIDRIFTALDRNGNGVIDGDESHVPPPPPAGGQNLQPDRNNGAEGMDLLPPFFFDKALRDGASLTREQFAAAAKGIFNEMDKNHDGVLSKDEARPPRGPSGPRNGRGDGEPGAPPPPNAKFIAAELRFGDKLVTGQPFSANTVIEDTRRLYDGSMDTKSMFGSFYRDAAGRTRREQPLQMVGGVKVAGGDGKPQMLVFINNFADRTQTFLDLNNKVAHTNPIRGEIVSPMAPREPKDAKTESLATQTMEGIKVEGTRTTFEIPVGELGNEKPIQVVTETWYSPELQVVVMSRHVDPIAGEHVFRLTNIKRAEPSPDLFTVPTGFRVEKAGDRRKPEE